MNKNTFNFIKNYINEFNPDWIDSDINNKYELKDIINNHTPEEILNLLNDSDIEKYLLKKKIKIV